MGRGRIRWGTSSWSEKSWVGPFYPAGTKQADFLPYYATRFDTVEADNTYYRIPSERMVTTWRARLPDGFRYAVELRNKAWIDEVLLDVLRTHGTALVWATCPTCRTPPREIPDLV